jgi:hypothetical protein
MNSEANCVQDESWWISSVESFCVYNTENWTTYRMHNRNNCEKRHLDYLPRFRPFSHLVAGPGTTEGESVLGEGPELEGDENKHLTNQA